ncbi:hypothetical protein J1614_004888 [Plenodomus biglobosus]|nr:hypothetical protein J1614_004888 [Plenodomus biglobosus]
MSTLRTQTTRLPRALFPHRRPFTTTRASASSSSFKSGPAPPRLPREEQEIFEKLQKSSTGAFSQPKDIDPTPSPAPPSISNLRMRINQSPDSSSSSSSSSIPQQPTSTPDHAQAQAQAQTPAVQNQSTRPIPKGDEFHPNMRRGAPPEFEGDVNPKTGEVGGPKNEPLRWGASADWSYNGRVTDF